MGKENEAKDLGAFKDMPETERLVRMVRARFLPKVQDLVVEAISTIDALAKAGGPVKKILPPEKQVAETMAFFIGDIMADLAIMAKELEDPEQRRAFFIVLRQKSALLAGLFAIRGVNDGLAPDAPDSDVTAAG